ncbi:MAG: cytochrome c-type biogenesis protein CcmH [Rhodospirillales bacterium]|nr:cytochrome c-type biogenesis protein CcmH [Rhodospirillales bacterium]
MTTRLLSLLVMLAGLFIAPALAVEPSEILKDPVLETRAREISKGLRCLVCQNQSIDDSNAELARDLRVVVRERLTAGDSDTAVIDYVVSRYGDYVLLEPPFKMATLALWLGPGLIVALGLLAVFFFFRRRQTAPDSAGVTESVPPPLTADEERRLKALLEDDG